MRGNSVTSRNLPLQASRPSSVRSRTQLACSLFSRRVWQPAVIRAGIPSITFHGLRHSFVAILVAAGCNVREVSEWAGQISVAFTLTRYGGLFENGSETAVDPAGPAAGRLLESVRQRASTGHSEVEVSPERVLRPTLGASLSAKKGSDEASGLVRNMLGGGPKWT
jgi:hypothetical protein